MRMSVLELIGEHFFRQTREENEVERQAWFYPDFYGSQRPELFGARNHRTFFGKWRHI
jgi:hypothetical protein